MSSSLSEGATQPAIFTTQTPYPLPSQKFMIPSSWRRYQLSQLINKALSLPQPIPFDFIIKGEILRGSLEEWCTEKGSGQEETLEIEYIESIMPPQKMSTLPHQDWVSSVSSRLTGYFITASYDGHLRSFDYSQNLVHDALVHMAPITSLCVVPTSNQSPDTHVLASASHDLTARLTSVSFSPDVPAADKTQFLASLHLHTAPVSSIATNSNGSHILTSSWDTLIALWDTAIPKEDEVPTEPGETRERKKRRKIADDSNKGKRKAPVSVLKSHTARVSKVVFVDSSGKTACSGGFDSTVRTWDVENGICTNTITVAEKPMLDVAVTSDEHTAFAASTDRTVTLFDLRISTSTTRVVGSLMHPATPSSIAISPSTDTQVVVGAYDGIARLWDVRSMKIAISSFRAWDGQKKILGLDWARGMVGIGGEEGLEVWRVDERDRRDIS